MELVEANGTLINTLCIGDGPPVVMVHGLFTASLASWFFTCAPEIARSHSVLLYDLRGHGRSPRTRDGYDVATLAGDLDALTSESAPFALVGHSYGALIAARFTIDSPGRVTRLGLVEAPLNPAPIADLDDELSVLADLARDVRHNAKTPTPRTQASIRALIRETSILSDIRSEEPLPDTCLAQIRIPVLCAYGSRSPYLDAGRHLASVIPDAHLAVLDGGHSLHVDSTSELTRHLKALIDAEDAHA